MFTPAEKYAAIRPANSLRIAEEQALLLGEGPPNEIELQAHWFSGDFGSEFQTLDGEPVQIVQFGVWNRGEGPDFLECAIRIGGELRAGPVELDTDVRDWRRHGHDQNPAFEPVILHLFFETSDRRTFTRTAGNRNVPQVCLSMGALAGAASKTVPLARPGRCSPPLGGLSTKELNEVLLAAAQFRLNKKAARFARIAKMRGPSEALFQCIAEALGYKQNKLPFSLLAQRLPLKELRKEPALIEPLLFGVAGFLPEQDLGAYPGETREYLRDLWSRWWPLRSGFDRLRVPAELWKYSGSRPGNHPQRRLAALAEIVAKWKTVRDLADFKHPKQVFDGLAKLSNAYWDNHYTLISKKTKTSLNLIGTSRATEILVNVFYPPLLEAHPERWQEFAELPAALENRSVTTAATRLLGTHPDRNKVLKSAAKAQGLLQIYEDFCRADASNCANCPFPEQLRQFWGG